MFPLVLNVAQLPILLAGNNELVLRRLALLDEDKAGCVTVFCEHPSEELKRRATHRLMECLPTQDDIRAHTVIMLAGYEPDTAVTIVTWAHANGKLVNVEDVTDLCDFYFTANVRRGDLVIAVSTGGASPTLAKCVRDVISDHFGPEWIERVRVLSDLRNSLKANGAAMKEIVAQTDRVLAEKGWLTHGDKVA